MWGRLAIQSWISSTRKGPALPPTIRSAGKVLVRIQLWTPTLPSQPSRSASEVRRIDATVRNVACDIGIIGNLRREARI